MPGPWEKYQKAQEAPAASETNGPWAKYQTLQAERAPTLGERFLNGIVKVGETIDSYTGAPTRAAISSLQDDASSPMEAARAFGRQFGESPRMAPTGRDIVRKAGVPDQDYRFRSKEPAPNDPDFYRYQNDPVFREQYIKGGKGSEYVVNPSIAAGLAMDIAADPTNLLPLAPAAKGIAKGAARLTSRAVNTAADLTEGAGRLAARGGKRLMQGALGAPESSINRYLARHAQLKDKVGAREMMEELAGKLDEGLKPARAKLAAAEDAVERAKLSRTEDLAELQIRRQEAAEALRRAEDSALGEAASRVSARVQQLDESVKQGSSAAFDILDKEGVVVPTQSLKSRMTAGIKALEERAMTDEQVAVVDLLKRYRERLNKFGKEIPGGEAKRILQSLDREISYLAPGEIGRMSKPDQALGALRRHIDTPLKESPAYAAQMAEVSRLMKVLDDTKALASDSAAARALKAARSATGKDQAEAIQRLASEFGDDLLAAADRRNLPEYHKLKALLLRVRETRKGLPVKRAESALEATQATVGDAVDLGRRGVAGIQDKINATIRQSTPSAVQVENLKKAGTLAGINMADELDDIRTIASFEKAYNRGSANTNFWAAVVGGTLGSVLGPLGTVTGMAGGAAFGRLLVDNFGPKVARVILDQVPNLQKMKPAQWIRSLDVPPQVQARLAQDLLAYRQISGGTKGAVAAAKPISVSELRRVAQEDGEPKTGPERWARSGLEKLGIRDQELASRLLADKDAKRLLIEASDLPPGSPKLRRIMERLEKGWVNNYGNESPSRAPAEVLRRRREPARGR